MSVAPKVLESFRLFDEANSQDPNKEVFEGKTYAKEVLYAMRMTQKLTGFAPEASEALQLTARCQHICRWEIPRESYEMNREGYLRWRQVLKKFHAQKAAAILVEVGYDQVMIAKVTFLLEKKHLKKNEETQTLEDIICLVFLEYYFGDFSKEHPDDKIIAILQKTWRKMSNKAHKAALKLPLSDESQGFLDRALKN